MGRRRRRNDDGLAALVALPIVLTINGFKKAPAITGGIWVVLLTYGAISSAMQYKLDPPTIFWMVVIILSVAGFSWWLEVRKRNNLTRFVNADVQMLDPYQFEQYVAAVITTLPGWKAEATQASNDQGCDVLATSPDGTRYAIQVKHYRNPVGNKAVQEIVASKAMYRAGAAIVVTSGPGYTRQAIDLANANGVVLWTLEDLATLKQWGNERRNTRVLVGFRA